MKYAELIVCVDAQADWSICSTYMAYCPFPCDSFKCLLLLNNQDPTNSWTNCNFMPFSTLFQIRLHKLLG